MNFFGLTFILYALKWSDGRAFQNDFNNENLILVKNNFRPPEISMISSRYHLSGPKTLKIGSYFMMGFYCQRQTAAEIKRIQSHEFCDIRYSGAISRRPRSILLLRFDSKKCNTMQSIRNERTENADEGHHHTLNKKYIRNNII